jgi:hypothetical protein
MGLWCKLFGHDWLTIFSKDQIVVRYNALDPSAVDRKSPRTLIIQECRCCNEVQAKQADTVGNCEPVDTDAALHDMREAQKKKEKPKKTIPVTVFEGQVGFSTRDVNLKDGDYEASVFDDRIEIRRKKKN